MHYVMRAVLLMWLQRFGHCHHIVGSMSHHGVNTRYTQVLAVNAVGVLQAAAAVGQRARAALLAAQGCLRLPHALLELLAPRLVLLAQPVSNNKTANPCRTVSTYTTSYSQLQGQHPDMLLPKRST
jgi:hypothetical protein